MPPATWPPPWRVKGKSTNGVVGVPFTEGEVFSLLSETEGSS